MKNCWELILWSTVYCVRTLDFPQSFQPSNPSLISMRRGKRLSMLALLTLVNKLPKLKTRTNQAIERSNNPCFCMSSAHDKISVTVKRIKQPWRKLLMKTTAAGLFVKRLHQIQEEQRNQEEVVVVQSKGSLSVATIEQSVGGGTGFVHECLGSLFNTRMTTTSVTFANDHNDRIDESFISGRLSGKLGPTK